MIGFPSGLFFRPSIACAAAQDRLPAVQQTTLVYQCLDAQTQWCGREAPIEAQGVEFLVVHTVNPQERGACFLTNEFEFDVCVPSQAWPELRWIFLGAPQG